MQNFWDYFADGREIERGVATIYEYERGLMYEQGKLLGVLEAGRYRVWPFSRRKIKVIDVRQASIQVANQKLLTADQITVTLNVIADYEVADVAAAQHKVANFRTQLYEDAQLAVRNAVGAVTVDELLAKRSEINTQILAELRTAAERYGITVLKVGIKDVILAPKVRDLLMREVEAKRLAQAMLIGAREEVAALRALANAAQLAAAHPQLLRLRELDTVRAFAATPGNTVVVGVGNGLPLTRNAATVSRTNSSSDELESED